jgi:hypothetical protein
MAAKKPFNPFYPLLVVVGVAFAITACAYGMMTVKMLQPSGVEEVRSSGRGLLYLLDRYGLMVLLCELAALAVLTFAAIGTDDFWTRRAP